MTITHHISVGVQLEILGTRQERIRSLDIFRLFFILFVLDFPACRTGSCNNPLTVISRKVGKCILHPNAVNFP